MTIVPGSEEGLSEAAQRRSLRGRFGTGKATFFTSDLSINEFVLVREAGFDPIGLVMGSSIYHIGFTFTGFLPNQEMETLSQAMQQARDQAMNRMLEEAESLGADGVIGVRLEVTRQAWGENLTEFLVRGTAVKHRTSDGYRMPGSRPFTCGLNGQDFWTLLQVGYRPVSLVTGTCVYHVAHQGLMQSFKQIGRNEEMAGYTRALYDAREHALSRMEMLAEGAKAEGIVAVKVEESSYSWGNHVIEFSAMGTAIIAYDPDRTLAAPTLTLPLAG